ncbi:MAG: hypothetical protein J6A04_01725 [Clostridia bacterium]|nr:hypothetical protein [Clostridia bacterium]
MTNFIYNNVHQLERIGEGCFGETGHIENVDENDVSFLQYIMAYRICTNKRINPICYDKVKQKVKSQAISISIQIFFEKVEKCKDDILYFAGIIKKVEEDPSFFKEYEKYSEMVA